MPAERPPEVTEHCPGPAGGLMFSAAVARDAGLLQHLREDVRPAHVPGEDQDAETIIQILPRVLRACWAEPA